jgi:hypothetical protein
MGSGAPGSALSCRVAPRAEFLTRFGRDILVAIPAHFGVVPPHAAENAPSMHNRTVHGTLRQYERPIWQPLLDLLGEDLVEWFMWMHEIELADHSALHAYKHVATRRYLHLTEDGRAFVYRSEDDYAEITLRAAIDDAFAGWERLLPEPTDPDALRAALRRARGACG